MAGFLNGSLVILLLRVFDRYEVIGGQLNHSDSMNNNPIDITNRASQEYRHLLPGEGQQTRDVSLELVFNSDRNYQRMRNLAQTREIAEFRIVRSDTGYNDDFRAIVTTCSDVASDNDKVVSTVSLQMTDFTPYEINPMLPIILVHPQDLLAIQDQGISFVSRAINWQTAQWYKLNDQTETFEAIADQRSPDLALGANLEDEGTYLVEYCNAVGCVRSSEAVLTLTAIEVTRTAIANLSPIRTGDGLSSTFTQGSSVGEPGNLSENQDEIFLRYGLQVELGTPTVRYLFQDTLGSVMNVTAALESIINVLPPQGDSLGSTMTSTAQLDRIGIQTSLDDGLSLNYSLTATLE